MFGNLFNKRDDATALLEARIKKLESTNAKLSAAINNQTKWMSKANDAFRLMQEERDAIVKRVEELELVTESSVHMLTDTAEQTKKHQRQIAGLYAWREKAISEMAAMKGTT